MYNFESIVVFMIDMQKKTVLYSMLLLSIVANAQVEEEPLDSIQERYILIQGDSIFQTSIPLDDVFVFSKLEFGSYKEKLRYYILRRKTHKVYPYAKLAADRLLELNDSLTKIKKKSKQKKYTKKVQKFIEGEFSEELKKLTRTEGQILVKLIYRQTGRTAFDLVKDLRSGWRAFWYSTTAKVFKISIKEEFDPESKHEDYLIEDILQRGFAAGRLEKQKTALGFDYASLTNKWDANSKNKN